MSEGRGLMAGRKGLVMGVANDHSIAWGIARALADHGAALALSYQGPALEKRVRPLAERLGAEVTVACDVEQAESAARAVEEAADGLGGLDFVLHSIAYSDKRELAGRYADTSRENFGRTMLVSCFSFTELAKAAAPRMAAGGALLTLTFDGSQRVVPSYNVMGVAKAALEASVRYLAVDLGGRGIRVNALSAGPMRTIAGAAIGNARTILGWHRSTAALGRNNTLEEVGNAGLFLLSDLAAGMTGEIHYVDAGCRIVAMGRPVRPETGTE